MVHQPFKLIPHVEFRRKSYTKKALAYILPTIPSCPVTHDLKSFVRGPGASSINMEIVDTMTREEEAVVFLYLNFCKKQYNKCLQLLTRNKVETPELKKWLKHVRHMQEYISRKNILLVSAMVGRYGNRYATLSWNDAMSAGQESLISAVRNFDVSKGFKFSTYASTAILRDLTKANAKQQLHNRRFSQIPENFQEDDNSISVEDVTDEDELLEVLKKVMETNAAGLDENEKIVIRHRFSDTKHTLDDVAAIIGLTRERARQIQVSALAKLRKVMVQD